jgi:hypothetical protein
VAQHDRGIGAEVGRSVVSGVLGLLQRQVDEVAGMEQRPTPTATPALMQGRPTSGPIISQRWE